MSIQIPTEGARPDDARRHNRTAVLRRLHLAGPCTRAVLAAELNLNRSTIKAVVDGLAASGLVTERLPARRSGAGRPSLLVVPRPQTAVVLAVDVRTELTTVALVGFGGESLGRLSWRLRRAARDPGELLTRVVEATRILGDDIGTQIVAAGVSVPGVVRHADGAVRAAPHLGWVDVPLGERLAGALRVPVTVAGDAELGALAEHARGVAREVDNLVYVAADAGVGGGVISGGAPLRGAGGYLGELGHMVVRPDGRACPCGRRGCWETEIGAVALHRALGLDGGAPRGELIAELRALRARPAAEQSGRLGEFAGWLTLGLVNVVNLLAPELVVLGDLLSELPAPVLDDVARLVREQSLVSRAVGDTAVVASSLAREAQLVGAAELAFGPVLEAV